MALAGIGIAIGMLFGGAALTLEEAERIAIEQAFVVRTARSNVEKAVQQRNQAAGGLGPRLDLNGTYTRFDERQTLFEGSDTQPPVRNPIDSTVLRLTVSYPIDITGVLRRGVRAADLNTRATEEALFGEVNFVKNLVRDAYFEILRANQSLVVQSEALESAKERLEKAKQRLDAGAISRFDVLRFETEVSRAEAAVIAAKNRVRTAKHSLNNLMGRAIETEFEVTEPSKAVLPEAPPDVFVEAALRSRPEVRSADTLVQAYEQVLKTQAAGSLPSLSISAAHTYTVDPGFGARENQTVATATLNFNIFDSGITKAKVAAAKQDLEQARIRRDQVRLATSLEVRQALVRAENARQTLEVAQKTVDQQRETLRVAQLRFDVGEGILLDVTDAQVELTRAQETVISAKTELLSAYAALQRAVGVDDLAKALDGEQK